MRRRFFQGLFGFTLILSGLLMNHWLPGAAATASTAESILGDVNGDGEVNSIDAFLLLQLHAGLIGVGPTFSEKADANMDGRVNALDAVRILQLHAGLIDSLNPPTSM